MGNALGLLLSDRPVGYHPCIARIAGGAANGIFLSQLLFCRRVFADMKGKNWDGWFYKIDREIMDETALTRYEVDKARRELLDRKIIKTERRQVPAKMHYLLDMEKIDAALESLETSTQTSYPTVSELDISPSDNLLSDRQRTITETTTEIPTETTTTTAAAVIDLKTEEAEDEKTALTFRNYQRVISFSFSPTMADRIRADITDVPARCVQYAFEQCELANVKKWSYVLGVLDKLRSNNWVIPEKRNGNGNAPAPPPLTEGVIIANLKDGETFAAGKERMTRERAGVKT